MAEIRIYTDGSARNLTHDHGGYGFVIINGTVRKFCGGSYYNTTTVRQEWLAIIKALQKIETENEEKIIIYSDAKICVDTVERGWIFQWKQRNFSGKANADLLKAFLKEYSRLKGRIKIKHVKGHSGNHWNEVCDILAKRGAAKKKQIKDIKDYQL